MTLSVTSAVLQIAVTFVTLPLYLKFIGLDRYGVMVIIWLLFDYFQLFNFGLDKATTNFLSRHKEAASEVLASAAFMSVALGLIGAAVLSFSFPYILVSWMAVDTNAMKELGDSLYFVALLFPLWMIASVCSGALLSQERFLAISVTQLGASVVFQIIPVLVAASFGPTLENIVVAGACSRASQPLLLICLTLLGADRQRLAKPSLLWSRRLGLYGAWTTVTGVLSPLIINLDRFLISRLLGPGAVALYSVPYNLAMRIQILPGSLALVLFPRMSQPDDRDRLMLAEEGAVSLAIVMGPALTAGAFLIQPFLSIWLGTEVPIALTQVGQILLVGIWFNALAVVPYVSLQGGGRPDVIAKIHLLEIAPFVVFLYLAIERAGVVGAAIAWSMRATLDSLTLFYTAGLLRVVFARLVFPTLAVTGATLFAWLLPPSLLQNIALAILAPMTLLPWIAFAAPRPLRRQIAIITRVSFASLRRIIFRERR